MNAPRYRPNCHCAAYRFPHRASGGACPHAEAATEVGADKDDDALDPILQGTLEGIALGVGAAVAILVICMVAAAVVTPALRMLP